MIQILKNPEEVLEFSWESTWNFCQSWNLTVTVRVMLLATVAFLICIFHFVTCCRFTVFNF